MHRVAGQGITLFMQDKEATIRYEGERPQCRQQM